MRNISNPKATLPTCPHCHQDLTSLEKCHYISFCPHCHNSILVNPFTPELEQMAFWQFVRYFMKTQWKLYAVLGGLSGVFVVIIKVIADFEKIHLGMGFWVTTFLAGLGLVGIGIYFLEKDLQTYRLKNKPIKKGVDTYDLVKEDIKISTALEELKTQFNLFSAYCPACHSQRLHHGVDGFVCQNCYHHFKLNSALKRLTTISLIFQYLFLLVLIRQLGDNLGILPLFIPVLFVINLITQYYWFKTPKWKTQSP